MGSLAVNLLGVLIAGILLGVDVWVVGIAGLAYVAAVVLIRRVVG